MIPGFISPSPNPLPKGKGFSQQLYPQRNIEPALILLGIFRQADTVGEQALLIHNNQMHKIVYVFLTFAFLFIETAGAAYAQSGYERRKFRPFLTRDNTEATISIGVRRNNFDFNIASDLSGTATPNILSELTWENIMLIELKAKVKHVEPANIYFIRGGVQLEGEVRGGVVASGDNQDSDWFGDNRTLEFSRSDNDASEGYAIGGTVDVGYKFNLTGPYRQTRDMNGNVSSNTRVSLAPLIGYGWDRQEYRITVLVTKTIWRSNGSAASSKNMTLIIRR